LKEIVMEIRSVAAPVPGSSEKTGATMQELAPGVKAAAQPVQQTALVQQPDAVVSQQKLNEALESINKAMRDQSTNLEFEVDGESDRTIVRVVDQKTGDVIRQVPTKEAMEIAKSIDRMQSLLVNYKA
jgi:flagellar protein FlaG